RNHSSSLSAAKAKDRDLQDIFFRRMELSYSNFFNYYNLEEAEKYANIYTKLHLFEEIDVAEFMNNYKTFRNSMKTIGDSIPGFELDDLLENIDLRLRANIHKYDNNQNWKTLKLILYKRPSLL